MRIWLRFFVLIIISVSTVLILSRNCITAIPPENEKFDALKRLSQVLDIVETYYVKDVTRDELINGALKGMLQSLDPHSTLLTADEFKEMQEVTSGEFCGVGIEITIENNQLTVVAPIDDTPADKAGIKAGDYILAVNGRSTSEMTLQEAANLIRGPKNTAIELTILHKDAKEPKTVKIKRETIPLISIKCRELEPGYFWLRISRFSEKTTSELVTALKNAAKKEPIKGIVLDMRNNPGGLLEQAITVTNTFIKEGTIVSIRGKQKESIKEFNALPQAYTVTAPIVVLVNAGSASAAEIVAGALGDHKRAILLGEKTFGKGSVQNIIPLADETGLKLTVAFYYTPSGTSIQAEGIEPDIILPFEPSTEPQQQNTLRFIREKDLRRHLEKSSSSKDSKDAKDSKESKDTKQPSKPSPEALKFLDKDNQLRMGLQLVKTLPKLKKIQSN